MAESFLTPLIVTPFDDGVHWEVFDRFEMQDSDLGLISAEKGFVTDFCSTPREFWSRIPPWGIYGKGSVIHDLLYAAQTCTRVEADQVFLRAMAILGVGDLLRYEIYDALRLFGEFAWNEHARKGHPAMMKNVQNGDYSFLLK